MSTLSEALENLQNGKFVVLVDDEDRENEGDLVLAAEQVTPQSINFMVTHARGLVCLSLEGKRVDELGLPMMASNNKSPKQTAFTVSIEAKEGVSTGISVADRAHTIRTAVDPRSSSEDLISPGHVFPLRAVEGGVLVRAGHTEGSIDLMRLAGLKPAAVICEIMNDDGSMARLTDLKAFSKKHGLPIVSIKDLIRYRMERESLIEEVASSRFPCRFSGSTQSAEFKMTAFRSKIDGAEHLALIYGSPKDPVLTRVHSECVTGDALGSLRCDCGVQLQAALQRIVENGSGVLVYMRRHEGRGIGLANKIRAYQLQDQGMDTVEANRHLGFKADLRHYGIGAQILRHLGFHKLRLLTNNPKKIIGLDGYHLEIVEQVPIEVQWTQHNRSYLEAKRDKLGHHLTLEQSIKELGEIQ